MFSTIISFNTVIDLGFSVTFIRFIAYAMGRYNGGTSLGDPTKNQYEISNQKHLQRVVGTLRVLFRRLTIFVFFLLLIGGTWFLVKPIEYLASPVEGFTSWAIVLLGTVISFKGNTYTVYLQGINRIAEFRRFETIFSLLSIFSSILVLIYGANLVVLILLNQFWVSISVIVNRWLCIKYNEGGFGKNEITVLDYKILAEIWPNTWRSGIGILMSFGLIQISSLFYAQSGDLEQISSYLFAMRVIQILTSFSQAPFYSKLPLLARLYAQNEKRSL